MTSMEREEPAILHVVHCVDTEGPLDESLNATFGRLEQIYGLKISPTEENLTSLQNQTFPGIDGATLKSIAQTFAPDLLAFNRNWSDVNDMNQRIFSDDLRSRKLDDFGQPWKISWFCMDHVGLHQNPRNKVLGFGQIHSYYQAHISNHTSFGDELQFHFHPKSISNNDLAAATNYTSNLPEFMESLARRLLDFTWFPTCYRPGFHSIRPDSNLLLEQWFPFDYSNQFHEELDSQPDLASGRFGDWRRSPSTWRGYNPSLTDHQVPGNLRRTTFRCLNLGTRTRLLGKNHVEQALSEASRHGQAILAFTDHDFRDIEPDVLKIQTWLAELKVSFPKVKVRYSTSTEAARSIKGLDTRPPRMEIHVSGTSLNVDVDRSDMFSIQPFLAIETKTGEVLHDNFDSGGPPGKFVYVFDELTIPLSSVSKIGVAITGNNGVSSSVTIKDSELASFMREK